MWGVVYKNQPMCCMWKRRLPPARGARYGTRIVWRVRASSNSCDSILVLIGVVGFNMMRERVLSRESLFTVGALVGHQGVR